MSEVLDFELCRKFYLVVEAKDGGTPALSAMATVNINLTDVNDNPPEFSQDVYSAVISEDASVGDSVISVGARGVVQTPGTNNPQESEKGSRVYLGFSSHFLFSAFFGPQEL